jgi:ferric-dicitrate binding protein FerR (iron transport regulator)
MDADINLDNAEYLETCACGRTFYSPGALKKHLRSCGTNKKRRAGALDRAKDLWREMKRRRLESDNNLGLSRQTAQSSSDQTRSKAGAVVETLGPSLINGEKVVIFYGHMIGYTERHYTGTGNGPTRRR